MRVGLIGTGPWASTVHAASLAQHPSIEFAGVWGRDPARTVELSSKFGARAYADPERLMDEVDALSFAVPPAVQADLALRAARRGCHVLLEKPIATAVVDARRLEAEVAAAGVASIVFFTHRFMVATQAWLERVRERGGLFCARVEIAFSAPLEDGAQARSAWRREYGALWDLGPHALSLLIPLLDEVTAVVAGAGRGDQVHLILQHPSNCSSTVSVSLTAPPAGTGTHLYADSKHGRQTLPEPSLENARVVAAHQAALDALIDLAGHPQRGHPCDVHFGARVVEVLDAAQRSLASGSRVVIASNGDEA